MQGRFAARRKRLLADAEVDPRIGRAVLPRLERFLDPFVELLQRSEQGQHARAYVAGLLSSLEYKNVESIAYLHDHEREPLQQFIGQSPWDHHPWLTELAAQVGQQLGSPDGILIFDPSAFPKKGNASVGVQRQWCGRLGKIDNCQVGVYLAYVGRSEHALVDVRLYLPKEWTKDKKRRAEAGVPKAVRFRTRHELALEMLDEHGQLLPHAWIGGDDEMGRCSWFRQELRSRGERYLLAVPSNTKVRDLKAPDPEPTGRGRRPRAAFVRVDDWCAAVAEAAWQTVEVRAGEKGPVVVQGVWTLAQARSEGRVSDAVEVLVVFREQQGDGTWKHDYLLSNAVFDLSLAEFARVFKAGHRVEECLQRAKGEAGLSDYEVRTWRGWHHHQALALVATWFLTVEARRGKKMDPGIDSESVAETDCWSVGATLGYEAVRLHESHGEPAFAADRGSAVLLLERAQPSAAVEGWSAGITPTVELRSSNKTSGTGIDV
jgi:SRSO17 transposase